MDALLRRRMMMMAGEPPTPTPVFYDYIESDGTQWIDSGIGSGLALSRVVVDAYGCFTSNAIRYSWWLFNETSQGYYVGAQANNTRVNFYYGASSWQQLTGGIGSTKTRFFINPPSVTYGNTTKNFPDTTATYVNNFRFLFNGGTSTGTASKLWRTKIYVDDVLVRDYQPCKDTAGVAAMYEHISGTYNYGANQSGNAFSVGNDS